MKNDVEPIITLSYIKYITFKFLSNSSTADLTDILIL